MLICVIVHVQMWCVCSITCWSNPKKKILVFYMFLKVILYFRVLSFCSKCIFVFFFKNWFRGSFARSSRLKASRENSLWEINFVSISYKESHDCLASISQLNLSHKMFLGKNWKFFNLYRGNRDCLMTVLRLKASCKSFCSSVVFFTTNFATT